MSHRKLGALATTLGLGIGMVLFPQVAAATSPTLPPGTHHLGSVPDSTAVHLVVTLRPRDPGALRKAVAAVSTPGSPRYREFLPTGAFGRRFGATDATIARVRSHLRSLGFSPGPTSANRLSIPIDTTAAAVASKLHAPLQRVRTADGRSGFTNTSAPRLPASLAGDVTGVLGLDNLPVAHSLGATSTRARVRSAQVGSPRTAAGLPVACSGAANAAATYGAANPADYLNAYSAAPLVEAGNKGAGQNVAVLSLQTLNTQDIAVYRQCFGTTGEVVRNIVDGGADPDDGTDESTLDVETIMGLAPEADIHFYESPNTDTGWYHNISAIVDDNLAKSVSVSWGICEPDLIGVPGPGGNGRLIDAEFDLFAQAALQGQTFFASSGDSGSAGCEPDGDNSLAVDDPASQPFVTAVGGTTLTSTSAPPTETVWNNSYGASGGGVSSYWLQPDYQSGVTDSPASVCDSNGDYCRSVPDVAASADPQTNALMVYSQGAWVPFGGTSVAAPQWAALTAIMNSSCPATNGFGMVNFTLYGLDPSAFNDVTVGNNDFVGVNGGKYAAQPGYDLATGLGTPNVANLAPALCAHASTLDTNESFVLAAYTDFTGSVPLDDPSDPVSYWVTELANGTPRSTFIGALATSDAWISHIVTTFYTDTLGRRPDAGGLAYWESVIASGRQSVAQVASYFYASPEYFRRDHSSVRAWVEDLYGKLLGRSADGGLSYWVTQAAVRGRTWVALAFYQSSESCQVRVENLYERLLHRNADAEGLAYWAGVIRVKGDIALAVNLADSDEYYRLASKRFPGP